jgi:oligoribonuclease (3'-5' exoribonuclease)
MSNRYVALDCEMGGLKPQCALLTAYFQVIDDEFNVIDELYLRMKPDDDLYICEAPAMEVNQIDLISHDKEAVSYREAKTTLYQFLKKNSKEGKAKLLPLGHSVLIDIEMIQNHLLTRKSFEQWCSYHYLDTGVIGMVLKKVGLIPMEQKGSVEAYAQYFGISWPGKAHDAKNDTLVTIEIYRRMLDRITPKEEGTNAV